MKVSRLIKGGTSTRLQLLFYVPETTTVVAEGEHIVKYDTRDTGAPNSAKDWKPKYVVMAKYCTALDDEYVPKQGMCF
jgi:hypothetical protein